jgi:Fe-S-cluster containining protein
MDQKELTSKIVKYAPLIDKATNTGLSNNEKDLYFLMDSLVDEVKKTYPELPCKNKCSLCCENYGIPRVTTIEWQVVHKYIVKEMPEELRKKVIQQTIDMHTPQIEELTEEQNRIQEPHTKRIKANSPRPKFKCGHCPFLVDQSCSIYKARPSICRAYGFFSIRVEGQTQVFTCQMAADLILEILRERNEEHWALPVWDKFADKIYELNQDKLVSTLPFWLLTHLDENNNVISKVDINPDFGKLKDKYVK